MWGSIHCKTSLKRPDAQGELLSWGSCRTKPLLPLRTKQLGHLPLWVPIHGTVGVWLVYGAAGLACAAACQGDGGCCVPGAGRGVTLLAAWAVPACAGTARGEGWTEEFAIWASLLLSCCYGTAEMLPGRRRWPACVTPGLPRGREMSPVYKALVPYPASPGENGISYGKIPLMGGFAGFICAARSCLQQGEMNSEQPKRRWVPAEHCGMQDFGVSLTEPRGSILPPPWTRRAAPSFLTGLSHQPTAGSAPSRGLGQGWESCVRAGRRGG